MERVDDAPQVTELWLHKKISPVRDDKLAIAYAIDELAYQGYVVDRLKDVDAVEYRSHWLYSIPIMRVIH